MSVKEKTQKTTLFHNEHKEYLITLPKIAQNAKNIQILYSPKEFKKKFFHAIKHAKNHIYLTTLYLEKDQIGKEILTTLFKIKKNKETLKIIILVDWHRAQRGRIGEKKNNNNTNTKWYHYITTKNPNTSIPIYGVPINTREALGVLHLKGFIIDNTVIYSGASINNVYFHYEKTYRYDRYYIIHNKILADSMIHYIHQHILNTKVIQQLNQLDQKKRIKIKNNKIRLFRQYLKTVNYSYQNKKKQHKLTITPLVGLGKTNIINKTIHHLICTTVNQLIICTPYFNIPNLIAKNILNLLEQGKKIEIIVGDKTASDFYANRNQKFSLINILPYLYENNLRFFLKKLQIYLNNTQLIIKIWKNKHHGYHIKGIWVDEEWQLITGHNLNPRAWNLDLENAILIHDPKKTLLQKKICELNHIRKYTTNITHYSEIQNINDYPKNIKTLIKRLQQTHFDKIINKIL